MPVARFMTDPHEMQQAKPFPWFGSQQRTSLQHKSGKPREEQR
jgi:hypothetical protein